MSSSRVQISLTGWPTALAISTAWRAQSCDSPRRPKPPPRWHLWTTTLDGSRPSVCATTWAVPSPFCVGAQTWARPSTTWAVQVCGSIVACGQVRHLVVGRHPPRGRCQRRVYVADALAHHDVGGIEPLLERLQENIGGHVGANPFVPDNRQRIQRFFCLPPSGRDYGHRGVAHLHHLPHARHAHHPGGVEALELPAIGRAGVDRGAEHARQAHVDGVDQLAGDLGLYVERARRATEQPPVL